MFTQFVKKIQFTRVLKANQRLREFNFLKHTVDSTSYFSVDTVDDRGNRIIFNMFDFDGKWKIKEMSGLPPWIYDVEQQLQNVILEEI